MVDVLIQYLLTVFMVIAVAILLYFFKGKVVVREDYYGIDNFLMNDCAEELYNKENVKLILKEISKSVDFVEKTYANNDNRTKEEKALAMSREAVRVIGYSKEISDNSLRHLIRIAAALKL